MTAFQRSAILLFNKPYQVLCQFTDQDGRQSLANFINRPGFYPAGRLDRDSEGLLVLTDDGRLQHRISDPQHKLPKRYLLQVEGKITEQALHWLSSGVELNDGLTACACAAHSTPPDTLWPRSPPVRFRKNIPTSWLSLRLTEGRNRQVRRMTAAVGFPTLRLIRTDVGPFNVWGLAPGASILANSEMLTTLSNNSQ